MAKEDINQETKELKIKVQEKKVVVGAEKVLKLLKEDKIQKVFLASNCPKKIKEDLNYYSGLSKVPVIELNLDNEELGLLCKKCFFVAVLGLIGE